jgi:hypothetical protein
MGQGALERHRGYQAMYPIGQASDYNPASASASAQTVSLDTMSQVTDSAVPWKRAKQQSKMTSPQDTLPTSEPSAA